MKHILCYGDSNTWGYRPDKPGCRFDEEVRWVGRLKRILGPEYVFIEEGLNGRTTAFDDPICPGRNGLKTLEAILLSHCPLDLVIIMLGVNDYKDYIHSSNYAMAEALGLYCERIPAICRSNGQPVPKILLISPAEIDPGVLKLDEEFHEDSIERSKDFGRRVKAIAERHGAAFLDAASLVRASSIDGLHLPAGEHAKLAEAVAPLVREILG
ncbi:MAG: SGNH/GDSL hydrolase family protein [Clostridia bacterium]|nr:SGNH/GDSL hydrolase family protein [Clostridia bacterium]